MEWLSSALEYLRGANLAATAFRLFLAMLFGGIIGLERGRRRRPAGFRTHILVCMGAALAMNISQYVAVTLGQTTDVSRLGAQVINGIGFLGAGTILVTGRQQVKGLTTAAGLWASACTGLAVGAGFYECVLIAFAMIFRDIYYQFESVIAEHIHDVQITFLIRPANCGCLDSVVVQELGGSVRTIDRVTLGIQHATRLQ